MAKAHTWPCSGRRQAASRQRCILLTFPNALPKEATAPLRAAGFHFNKVLQHWEGMTRVDEAQRLAAAHGGTARRVAPAPLSEGPATEAA